MEWTAEARLDEWDSISEEITEMLRKHGFDASEIVSFIVALEEIYANISQYAYRDGKGTVTVGIVIKDREVISYFVDEGIPFDPLKMPEPDVSSVCSERKIGGLGIFMAKDKTDYMSYEYSDNKNILTLMKVFS